MASVAGLGATDEEVPEVVRRVLDARRLAAPADVVADTSPRQLMMTKMHGFSAEKGYPGPTLRRIWSERTVVLL